MKILRVLLSILAILTIIYLFGPAPEKPVYSKALPIIPDHPAAIEEYIRGKESRHPVKPDNEARIIWWNDSIKTKTEYSVVYLHGFSSSFKDGDPVHKEFAQAFGCNLYLSRLAEHGLDTPDAMINLTADRYWESAKEALETGKKLGKKVILMSTSTGGTNALQLAATYPGDVAALILLSPNVALKDPSAWVANNHWGLQAAKLIIKGDYYEWPDTGKIYNKYWYTKYRLEGIVALEELLETTMVGETFSKISQPALMLYYYKDEKNQDDQVSVAAMKKMFEKISTPEQLKRSVAIPDAGAHVIGSSLKSKDLKSVRKEIFGFATEVLKMQPVIKPDSSE